MPICDFGFQVCTVELVAWLRELRIRTREKHQGENWSQVEHDEPVKSDVVEKSLQDKGSVIYLDCKRSTDSTRRSKPDKGSTELLGK